MNLYKMIKSLFNKAKLPLSVNDLEERDRALNFVRSRGLKTLYYIPTFDDCENDIELYKSVEYLRTRGWLIFNSDMTLFGKVAKEFNEMTSDERANSWRSEFRLIKSTQF